MAWVRNACRCAGGSVTRLKNGSLTYRAHRPGTRFRSAVVQTLRTAGRETYWAGGCAQTSLLGLTPKDHDMALLGPSQTGTQALSAHGRGGHELWRG